MRWIMIFTLLGLLATPAWADGGDAIDALNDVMSRQSARDKAIHVVSTLSRDRNPVFRANAIEAMQPMPDRALPLVQQGLADESPVVRFAAVVTAGQLDFKSLRPAIRKLTDDVDPSVRAAALYALHRLGDTVDLSPLGKLIVDKNPSVRANVAMLLGLIGEPSAIPMLKQSVNAPMRRAGTAQVAVVRCQFAEAIVKLGDDSELDTLRASAFNTVGEVRVIAVNAMGAVGDQSMIPALRQFLRDREVTDEDGENTRWVPAEPVEVRLAAAAALARMGRPVGLPVVLNHSRDANPITRAQAAWAMGWFNDEASHQRLSALLEDPTPVIRIAAAASIIRRAAPR